MTKEDRVEITVLKAPLKRGENHPGAAIALDFVKNLTAKEAYTYLTVFKEEDTDGEFESCVYAMEQLLNGKMVSDAYLCGLVLVIQEIQRINDEQLP